MNAEHQKELDDLHWWEEAFGAGNVIGWTYRNHATVKLGSVAHQVNQRDRAFFLHLTGIPVVEELRRRLGEAT